MDGTNLTTVTTDILQAVRESAMLADVSIGVWMATKNDKAAMDKLAADAGATGNVGKVIKNILAGADSKLKDAQSAHNAARQLHYGLTLPWVSDPNAGRQTGPRLLPHLLLQRYIKEMQEQKNKAEAALETFLTHYPWAVVTAKNNLGALADDVDYPSVDEVRGQFRINFDFEPLPAESQFKGLPPLAIERLGEALRAKQERMLQMAQESMWRQVRERVSHMLERVNEPDKRFTAATVENVRELVSLLPGWNVTGTQEIGEIVTDIQEMLNGIEAKDIRETPAVRQDVASRAQQIVDKLNRFGL